MIETIWIAGLAAAWMIRARRLLAAIVLIKGAVSYLGFMFAAEVAPLVSDIAIGTVAIPICVSLRTTRADLLAILFVVFPLLHWFYWSGWEVGVWFALEYWVALMFAYSAMVATIFPWERLNVRWIMARFARLRLALGGPSRVHIETPENRGRAATTETATERG